MGKRVVLSRVGAWKVAASFLPDISSNLALDLPAKAAVQKVGWRHAVSWVGTGCEGDLGGPEGTLGRAWEAEPSSALPNQLPPCLRTCPLHISPQSLTRSLWLSAYLSLMISLPPPLPANTWD